MNNQAKTAAATRSAIRDIGTIGGLPRHACVALAALACTGVSGAQCEMDELGSTDAESYDAFGSAHDIDGNRALVGSPRERRVYVYERSSAGWAQTDILTPSDAGQLYDEFGAAVAIHGELALVGAFRDDEAGDDSGAVCVFELHPEGWVQTEKLFPNDPNPYKHFGYDVDLSGNQALIGAWQDSFPNGAQTGAAYMFDRTPSGWTEVQKLVPYDGTSVPQIAGFGASVTISGSYAIIGAPWHSGAGSFAGAAFVYEFAGTGWNNVTVLHAGDPQEHQWFGQSVDLSGSSAIVGAYKDSSVAFQNGAAYLYHRSGTQWYETNKLMLDDPRAEDNFGYSVAMDGGTAVVGCPGDSRSGLQYSGSAHVYDAQSGAELYHLSALDPAISDQLGFSVSIAGGNVMASAPYGDYTQVDSGTIHAFDIDVEMRNYCEATPNSTGKAATIHASGCASEEQNDLVLVARDVPAGEPGLFYYGPTEANVAFGDGVRCIGGSIHRLFPFVVADELGVMKRAIDNGGLEPGGELAAGTTWKFQAWFRDPEGGPFGFNLSDAMSITFTP